MVQGGTVRLARVNCARSKMAKRLRIDSSSGSDSETSTACAKLTGSTDFCKGFTSLQTEERLQFLSQLLGLCPAKVGLHGGRASS